MFTGIVEEVGAVRARRRSTGGQRVATQQRAQRRHAHARGEGARSGGEQAAARQQQLVLVHRGAQRFGVDGSHLQLLTIVASMEKRLEATMVHAASSTAAWWAGTCASPTSISDLASSGAAA